MKNLIYILLTITIGLGSTCVFSQEAARLDLKELRKKADSVLNQSNVSARSEIDVVFRLVDRLLEEDSADAEHYLIKGLEHFPWNLKYQMVYAELLAKRGKTAQARDKADLVLQYAETDDLIERARKVAGEEALPKFDKIKSLPGSHHCVVLVPMMEADKWLIVRVKEQLSEVLGIPVYIQTIETDYPPFGRDLRGAILNQVRRKIKEDINDPQVTNVLKDLDITKEDLAEEAKLLRVLKTLMGDAGPERIVEFESYLEQSRGKDPQWDANQLQEVLFRAVKPYRRKNVAYLGMTFADIYAKDFNFLFGWADRQGGVMSYRRFTADFNDEIPNQDRLIKRTLMQCLSSTGHIYGIKRCTNPTCARAYPNSLPEHDAKKGTLCAQCRSGFKRVFAQTHAGDSLKAATEK